MTRASAAFNLDSSQTAAPAPAPQVADAPAATLIAADGEALSARLIEIGTTGAAWTATLTRLDRPGLVASLYYGRGVREVTLLLEDGRQARARITGTAFIADGERICQLTGLEPLA